MDAHTAQLRLDHIQARYREWLALQPKLLAAQRDWQESCRLMAELEAFYLGDEYMQLADAVAQGLPVSLHTGGEHSVLSEDALWHALHEHQQQAWQRLRSAVDVLDKQAE